jgi:hypothetical protein
VYIHIHKFQFEIILNVGLIQNGVKSLHIQSYELVIVEKKTSKFLVAYFHPDILIYKQVFDWKSKTVLKNKDIIYFSTRLQLA